MISCCPRTEVDGAEGTASRSNGNDDLDMVGRENLACRDNKAQFNKKELSYHQKAEEKLSIKRFHVATRIKQIIAIERCELKQGKILNVNKEQLHMKTSIPKGDRRMKLHGYSSTNEDPFAG